MNSNLGSFLWVLIRLCVFRWNLGSIRRRFGDGWEDQEARQDAVLPEEVATHHLGHLHRRPWPRGQQQRLRPLAQPEPAQVHVRHLPARRRRPDQRARRHAGVKSEKKTARTGLLNQWKEANRTDRVQNPDRSLVALNGSSYAAFSVASFSRLFISVRRLSHASPACRSALFFYF